jgi:hypothetical protein
MRRVQVCMAATIAAFTLVSVLVYMRPIAAQQRACLHGQDEAPDQLARRQLALGLTRHINTLQAGGYRAHGSQPLATLPIAQATPDGFTVHLVSDGVNYAFSVKDTLDPCRFGYFSDQEGVIYVGQVIQ